MFVRYIICEKLLFIIIYAYEDSITGTDSSLEFNISLVVQGSFYKLLQYNSTEKDKFKSDLAGFWEANESHVG